MYEWKHTQKNGEWQLNEIFHLFLNSTGDAQLNFHDCWNRKHSREQQKLKK